MNPNIGIGIIGCGGIANGAHLPPLSKVSGGHIAALCDINPENLQKTAEKYHIDSAHCFTDYHELIACPDVDAVEICTPNNLHCPMAQDVLLAGKPVNIEKPVGISTTEAEKIRQLAVRKQLPVMVCFSYRFMPAVRYAKKLMQEQKIGRIVSVYAQYLKSSAYIPGRRLDWRFDQNIARYGVSGDLAVHIIDMVRFLAGDFVEVCAQTGIAVPMRQRLDSDEYAPVTTDDYCHFLAELKDGIPAEFGVSRCAMGNKNHIMIDLYGDKGAIRFDLNHPDQIQLFVNNDSEFGQHDGEMQTIQVPEAYKVGQEQTFIDLLHGNPPEYTPNMSDGVLGQRVLDALMESVDEHRWVKI